MNEHRSIRHRYRRHISVGSLVVFIVIVVIELLSQRHLLPGAILNIQPDLLPVTHVEDGDTITVREPDGSTKIVRLIGVDTPESVKPNTPVQCGAEAASSHTKAVMTGAKVRLAPDPDDSDTDKYGRLLRYVYLSDGTLYNEQLIQQGYGFAYVVFDFSKIDQFKADEVTAKASNLGLWATCNVNASSEIKQTTTAK